MKSFTHVVFLFCSLAIGPCATGQMVYGSIRGNITDNSGKPVRGATLSAKSVGKGTTAKATADVAGGYVIGHLVPDDYYDVSVDAVGFQQAIALSILVFADQDASVDFKLSGADVSRGNASTEDKSDLILYRADVITTFGPEDIRNLPVSNRTFSNLLAFVPGATTSLSFGALHENIQAGVPIQLNSLSISGTAYEQDGTAIPKTTQGSLVINPSLDAVSQMQVSTENLDAEFGETTAVVNLQTKSGTNTWHGSAFEYYQSQFGEAGPANLAFPGAIAPKSDLFGGSIGGPVVRNKLFAFANYEGGRQSSRGTATVKVPSTLVRSSCLDPGSTYCDLSGYGVDIYQPGTNNKFVAMGTCAQNTSACIPFSSATEPTVSTQAVNLLKLFPLSNAGDGLYTASGKQITGHDNVDTRMDYVVSTKSKLFARYSFGDDRLDAPPVLGKSLGGLGFLQGTNGANVLNGGFSGQGRVRSHTLAIGFNYDVQPDLAVDLRFGFGRYHSKVLPSGYGTSPAQAAGIPNVNLGDILSSALPSLNIPGFPIFGNSVVANNCSCPLLATENQFQVVTNWTKINGHHITKWGADLRYLEGMRLSNTVPNEEVHRFPIKGTIYNVPIPDFNTPTTRFGATPPAGSFAFSAANTASLPDSNGLTIGGLGLATFLLGNVTAFSRSLNNALPEERERQFSFYGEDVFRITPRLTVTYGLRWEIYFPQTLGGKGQGAWLDLSTGLLNVAGYGNTTLTGNVRNSYTNFGPLLGLAYAIRDRAVVRAGYRRSFDPGLGALIFGDNVTHNPPITELQNCGSGQLPSSPPFTLDTGPPLYPSANCRSLLLPSIQSSSRLLPEQQDLTTGSIYPAQSANVVPARIRVPTVDAWNVSFQQELYKNLTFTLAYVGNKGTHVFFDAGPSYDLNQPAISKNFSVGRPISPNRYPLCQQAWAANTPNCSSTSGLPFNQNINYFGANSSNHYHSLQASLRQRFTRNTSLLASYTWSKVLDFSPIYFNQDPRLGYGPGDFDRTHKFTMTNVTLLPLGRGHWLFGGVRGLADRVAGGWSLSTTTVWASGLPFSPTYGDPECVQDRDTGPCQPNLVGVVHITGSRRGWFTVAPALQSYPAIGGPWQRPITGTFGDAGRNSLRGPSFFQSDLSLVKTISLRERMGLQFRWDVYNAFNRVNLGAPNSCVDCGAGSGQITTEAINAIQRQMQFALRLEF